MKTFKLIIANIWCAFILFAFFLGILIADASLFWCCILMFGSMGLGYLTRPVFEFVIENDGIDDEI